MYFRKSYSFHDGVVRNIFVHILSLSWYFSRKDFISCDDGTIKCVVSASVFQVRRDLSLDFIIRREADPGTSLVMTNNSVI